MKKEEGKRRRIKPAEVLALSFFAAIIVGTIFLSFPQATSSGKRLSFINALFTATSATCVTGLTVVDTGSTFSYFGKIVILFLIQIGGLGIMTMSTLFVLLIGKRVTLKERLVVQEALNHSTSEGVALLLKYVLILTFSVEGIGAVLLWCRWAGDETISHPLFYSVFHSVSAFCNSGFSLFRDSLINYRGDFLINSVVILLVIIGGLGFVVVSNLSGYRPKKGFLTLHTKLVVRVSLFLIILTAFFIFFMEKDNIFSGFTLKDRLLASCFQAITPRTAGFNTIPIGGMTSASLFFLILLMFVGASPGSTGGGIKTSTFGILLATICSMIRGKEEVTLFKKTVPREIVRKALAIFTVSLFLVLIFTLLLLITEKKEFGKVFFETVSAFGTVGLSTGITSQLSFIGRIIIIITMFIGRIGPLTLAIAIGQREHPAAYKYPEERIMVG
jgi:trk system potassium uptake protein TrkH